MSTENDFESAFNEASGGNADPVVTPEDTDVVTTEDTDVDTTADVGDGPGDAAPDVTTDAADPSDADVDVDAAAEAEPDTKVTPAPAAKQESAPAVDPKFLAQAMAEYMESQKAQQQPQQASESTQQAYKPKVAADYLDDNQKAALAAFESDWPEVAPVMQAVVEAAVKATYDNIMYDMDTKLDQTLAPIGSYVAQSQEDRLYAAIGQAHPDWESHLDGIAQWIDTLSPTFKPGAVAAWNGSDLTAIVSLISDYKNAKGLTSAAPEKPASPAAQVRQKPSVASVSATAAPPKAQRSAIAPQSDPNDFEGAFQEALAAAT